MMQLRAPKRRASETTSLVHPILTTLNRLTGVRVFRNNTGMLEDRRGAKVRYGLGVGSADIVGMVGVGHGWSWARFFALEVKRPGGKKPTDDQLRWGETIIHFGGFYAVVYSIDEAVAAVVRCQDGKSR